MRIVLTGSAGLLGKALIETAPTDIVWYLVYRNTKPKPLPVIGNLIQHDLRRPINLSDISPDVIIHCATEGSVDKIQKNPALGTESILAPTIHMIDEAEKLGCKLVYLSTNAVFNGENPPYGEDDQLCPINSYGIFKAACELAVQGSKTNWLTIRPLLMYGWQNPSQRANWASTWIEKLRHGETCRVVYDVISQPLYNLDCARAIWLAIQEAAWNETFNVAGADTITLYDFAKTITTALDLDRRLIEPVPSEYFNLAPRPKNTSFNISKMRQLGFNPMGVAEGIDDMLKKELKQCLV